MFLGVLIVRYKMDALFIVPVVYNILAMYCMIFLWKTIRSVVANTDCIITSSRMQFSFVPLLYVTNLNCDLLDLVD